MNHRGTVPLQTERLELRRLTEEDAPSIFQNWAGDDLVTRFVTWPTHKSAEDSLAFAKGRVEEYQKPNFYDWGIVLKETGELIGTFSIVETDADAESAEIGYVIGRRFWGNGYTAEAAKKVISFLFEEIGANRVFACHDRNNPNSGRVMQKAGMTKEGTLRKCMRIKGQLVDLCYYSILKEEYERNKASMPR